MAMIMDRALLDDKDLRRLQALAMLHMRIEGATIDEIGQRFRVSAPTVKNRLNMAKRDGLLKDYADRILEELVPAAFDAYANALKEKDLDAARDVLFGTGLLSKSNRPQIAPPAENSAVELTLESYRVHRTLPPESGTDSPRALGSGEGREEEVNLAFIDAEATVDGSGTMEGAQPGVEEGNLPELKDELREEAP